MGWLLLYFREDILSRFLNSGPTYNTEIISVEIYLRKRKWLITCCYNLLKSLILNHLDYLNDILVSIVNLMKIWYLWETSMLLWTLNL